MTKMITASRRGARSAAIRVRVWWPVPVLLVTSLAAQKIFFESRYDVSGHAAGHLSNATAAFPAFALVAILLYATPAARRQLPVLATSVTWLLGTALVLVGNVRVVDALINARMGDTPTSQLVEDPTIASAHELANWSPWLALVAALALTAALWRCGQVSGRVAIGAAVLSVILPPWIFPGAGVLVVTIARCLAMDRRFVNDRELRASPPAFQAAPRAG